MTEQDFAAEFAAEIDSRADRARGKEKVSPYSITLESGKSFAQVRVRGGFITGAALTDPTTSERVPILYGDADRSINKYPGSHIMHPVGPSDGIGGQHGFPRWADYKVWPTAHGNHAALQAKRSDLGTSVCTELLLHKQMLVKSTTIRNSEDTHYHTSLGEHFYFDLPKGRTADIFINGCSVDFLLKQPGAAEAIDAGESFLWQGFDGTADITFPDGKRIGMDVTLKDPDESIFHFTEEYLGMLLWRRPESPSICFEPVAGCALAPGTALRNDLFHLGPYKAVKLTTHLELLGPLKRNLPSAVGRSAAHVVNLRIPQQAA